MYRREAKKMGSRQERVTDFWNWYAIALVAAARAFSARTRIAFSCEPEDFAQAALSSTIAFLNKKYGIDCRETILTPRMREEAIKYGKKCTRNGILSQIREIRSRDANVNKSWDRVSSEGTLEISRRYPVTPEQSALASDLIRAIERNVTQKRAESISSALKTIAKAAGNQVTSEDLTFLANISANELSYDRRRLRPILREIGYKSWEIDDDK
jgi:hypothetical protein